MAIAGSLLEAAELTTANLSALWIDDTLRDKVIAFWQQANPTFSDQTPNDRPVGAWLAIIAVFAPTILDFETDEANDLNVDTIETFRQAIDYVYRICKFANAYQLISSAQKTALLAAYNDQFA